MIPLLFVLICCSVLNVTMVFAQTLSNSYFQESLEKLNVDNFTRLECNVRYSGLTTISNPVEYYILDLTEEILSSNPSGIGLSTCCNPYDNDYNYKETYLYSWYSWYNANKDILNISEAEKKNLRKQSEDDWMGYCGFDELWPEFYVDPINATWEDIEYFYKGYSCGESKYCHLNESLDTTLYIISEKKNRFSLFDVIDDVYSVDVYGCNNSHKSIFDLVSNAYYPGRYIIGIAGFYKETGSYEIKLNCNNKYSFPIKESEIDINNETTEIHELSCGTKIENQLNSKNELVSYYKFTINERMNGPIVITTCNGEYNASSQTDSLNYYDAYLYLIGTVETLDTITSIILDESDESIICNDFDYRPADLVLYDLDNKYERNKEYFIIVQGYENDRIFKNFSISMSCGDKYSSPMKSVQIDLKNASIHDLECNDMLFNQQNNEQHMVSFYRFNISDYMYPPIVIRACDNKSVNPDNKIIYEMYTYLIKHSQFEEYLILHQSSSSIHVGCSIIEIDDLSIYGSGIKKSDRSLYIAVQGIDNSFGTFSISMGCGDKYSFPISNDEFNDMNLINNNILNSLECGMILEDEFNYNIQPISIYKFNITDNMYPPIFITTCNEYENHMTNNYDSYMYLLKNDNKQITILDESYHSKSCGELKWNPSEITINNLNEYEYGEYIAIIQGYKNEFGNFSVHMKCNTAPKVLNTAIVMGLTFGLLGLIVLLFIIWYIYQYYQYMKYLKTNKNKNNKDESKDRTEHALVEQEAVDVELVEHISQILILDNNNNTDKKGKTSSFLDSPHDHNHGIFGPIDTMRTTTIRRIGVDEDLDDLNPENNEDKIQRLIGHVLSCCEEEAALDVYQVLAVRYMDEKSRKIKVVKPFETFGINTEIILFSPFHQSLFIVIIIGLLQTMGITVVVSKLITTYFDDTDNFLDNCSMDADRWEKVYLLKILSFLWSLVITFSVGSVMRTVKHDGFYEVVTSLKKEEIHLMNMCICFGIIRCGQIINYYSCLLSVIGSFFIIFETNEGEQDDDGHIEYSHSALDMILNAVALFFMLEIDDIMVGYDDFRDVENILHQYMEIYTTKLKHNKTAKSDEQTLSFSSQCFAKTTLIFGFFVKFCLYFLGFIAPFFIFFCY